MNRDDRTWVVALALAIGLSLAVTVITVGVLYDAIFSEGPGLSDNATQVLTAAFGGMIGVLGSYVGFHAGTNASNGGTVDTSDTSSASSVAVEPDDSEPPPPT